MLTARDALCPWLARVTADQRPPSAASEAAVYAVFAPEDEPAPAGGGFLGLVTRNQIAPYPERIFADLLARRVPAPAAAGTPVDDLIVRLDRENVEAITVEERGAFLGAVTRSSLLSALLRGELTQLRPAPAEGLHEATLRLLGLLTSHEVETELLQQSIETLTTLLKTRYGAIGIVDEHGALTRFVHTGIAPEQAARIGQLPQGRGLLGVVIHENHALRLDDMSKDPRSAGFPAQHPPMKSLLAVPISHEGRVYGRLYFSDKFDATPFSADDEGLAARSAGALALTLAHHRLQSERLKTARDLEEQRRVHTTLLSNLAGMVYRCRNDPDWTVEFASDGALALTGHSPGDFVARKVAYGDLIHPDDREKVWNDVQAAVVEHRPFELRYRICTADGREKRVWEQGQGVFAPDGELLALEGYIADVTAQHQAEEQANTLASAVEQTADSVVITDREGLIEYVNPAFEKITGFTRVEAVGRKPNLVKSGEHDTAFYRRLWDTIRSGAPFREVFVNRRKNGTLYYEEKTITPLKNERGEITHFVSTGKDISARMRSEQETRRMQHFLDSVVENLPNMLFVKDAKDLKFVRFNKAAEELLGYARTEMLGKSDHDFFPKEEADFFTTMDREVLKTGDLMDIPREPVHTVQRGTRLLHTKKIPIFDEHGQPLYLLGISEDITERVQAEDTAQRLGRILDNSTNEIYVFGADSMRFLQANQGAQKNLGYSLDELRAMTPLDIKPDFSREGFEQLIAPLKSGEQEAISFVTNHRRKDGSLYPVEIGLQLSRNETPPVFVAIVQDITERKHAEERLSYLAYYDTLTGLPNRQLLRDRLRQTMFEADRSSRVAAVMLLDLDRFKFINDTLGHEAGDTLLKGVAERLTACVRHGDTVARLGGDEFTVVLANVAQVDDVAFVTKKILESFAQPFTIAGRELFVSPSIGITLYPHDDRDIDNLLKNADAAMYHAKESGRNTFQFFTAELNERAVQRLELETALRHALERDEFLLHYQPVMDLKTGQPKGVEALLRWRHPQRGLVPPLDFIPLAEETGLIVPIGEWVLRTACAQAKAWHAAGFCGLHMAVNISGRQFQQQNLTALVTTVLAETGLDPQCFNLELTESVLMRNVDAAIAVMGELDAVGVGFSIDDFGTGYSSLSYLKRFPIDVLKIDRSFVCDITTDPDDAAIVTAIMALAHTLDIAVVAEGVETQEQLAFLRARGCDVMQGYYFSKPVDAEALTALLKKTTKQGKCQPRADKRAKMDPGAR
jgi:diguanylate cyclase (GGDEF)-like protein/PAS domain S-box-containing protein